MNTAELERQIKDIVTEALFPSFHALKKRVLSNAGVTTVDHIEFTSPEGPLVIMDYEDLETDYTTDVVYNGRRYTVIGRSPDRIRVKAAS